MDKIQTVSDVLKSKLGSMYEYLTTKATIAQKIEIGTIGGIFLFVSTRYIYSKMYRSYYNLPPGPNNIIPGLSDIIYTFTNSKWYLNYTLIYGQVFSLTQFNKFQIFVNDSQIAKQLLSKALDRDLPGSDQTSKDYFQPLSAQDNTTSFISMNGKQWSKMRMLMHSKLIRVMNTETVNEIMNQSLKTELKPKLEEIISDKQNYENKWYCRETLSQLAFNIIFQANFGTRVGFKDNELCRELAADIVYALGWEMGKRNVLFVLFPWLTPKIIPKSYLQPAYDLRDRVSHKIEQLIEKRQSERSNNDNRSVMDQNDKTFMDYIREQALDKDNEYSTSQEIADIISMFVAGTDTTSISTEWGLILLSKQPVIQEKVRNELMRVLNDNNIDYRRDSMNIVYDLKLLLQLPLFRACIHEILRISCVIRTGLMRKNTKDMTVTLKDGTKYNIPKNTQIFYNVEAIHYDLLGNENWKNTEYGLNYEQICLENWLKQDTGKFYQNPSFITFGHGKRDCIGKQLAMKEMRVILGYLLLNYKFSIEDKYMKMKNIAHKGGDLNRGTVCKPNPEIPLIVQPMRYD